LAAANPKYSRFDIHETVATQITMPVSLLSRFDIIYPLLDIPGETDIKIAEHILKTHRTPEKIKPELGDGFIRKYFSFAKRQRPKITKEASDELFNYYIDLRKSAIVGEKEIKAIPITPRQLEGLIRLSEASAKLRLSKEVEHQDAIRAKNIFISFMQKMGVESESGGFDVDKIHSAVASSERSVAKKIKTILLELGKEAEDIHDVDIIQRCLDEGISEEQIDTGLQKLSGTGDIYSPKRGVWKLLK